jgi:ComF family protein
VTRPVGRALAAARDSLLAFFFPDACVACGSGLPARRRHLCEACERGLRVRPGTLELPGSGDGSGDAPGEGRGRRAFYALEFEGAARALIHELKYRGAVSIAVELAELAAGPARRACVAPPDVVTAVPLHPVRLRERGFNQSELIAWRLARLLGSPARETLTRTSNTTQQALLGRRQRLVLPAAAFRSSGVPPGIGRVLLVDDVVTTGATMAAAASALAAGGASEVICFAVAGSAGDEPADAPRRIGLTGL